MHLSIATMLMLQCHSGPSGPGIVRIDLTADLAADPTGQRLVATVAAHNRGTPVWFVQGCCKPTFDERLVAPDGVEYWAVQDPRPPLCLCVEVFQRLLRNETFGERLEFAGTMYDANGIPRPAPPGHYVWRFAFSHCETAAVPPAGCEQVMTSVEFNWPPPRR